MIYVLLAAVTVDPTNAVQAAAPWVEQAIGALVLSSLGALGWLIRNALRKMTEDAVASERAKQAEDRRIELVASGAALKLELDAQKTHCSDCHQHVDARLSRGDTAIELLRRDVTTLLAAVSEMRGLLLDFLGKKHLDPGGGHRGDTNPRIMLPPRDDEG